MVVNPAAFSLPGVIRGRNTVLCRTQYHCVNYSTRGDTVPDTHKFPLDARIRIASHARIRIASHRIASHAGKCAHVRAFASHGRNARICAHSHVMRENARICEHSHRMRGNARICIACAEMRALRRERRVNEIAGMTPARVFWCQTPETGSLGAFTNTGAKVEIKKDIYLFIQILSLPVTDIYGKVSSVYCHCITLSIQPETN